MDPVSIIVSALALGAAAGLKPTAEKAVKDTYSGLKALIQRKFGKVSLDQLEQSPQSKARRAVVEEDLSNMGAGKDDELIAKAKELLDVIERLAPEAAAAIGVNLTDVKAAALNIGKVSATGTGVHVERGEFSGDITIEEVQAGRGVQASPKA